MLEHRVGRVEPFDGQRKSVGNFSTLRRRVPHRCPVPLGIRTRVVRCVLPPCYQNTPYQDDPGRHPASPDRRGSLRLGRFGCAEYVVRGNS